MGAKIAVKGMVEQLPAEVDQIASGRDDLDSRRAFAVIDGKVVPALITGVVRQ